MKVKVSTLMSCGVLWCVALDIGLQNLPILNLFYFGHSNQIQTWLYILMAVVCLFAPGIRNEINGYLKGINLFVTTLIILFLFLIYYTNEYTNQSLQETINVALTYLKILLVYPVVYILHKEGERRVENGIIALAIIYLLYSGFAACIYNTTGVNINENIIRTEQWQRMGLVRIQSISISWLACVLLFKRWICEKRAIALVGTMSILGYIIFINQGRACYVAMIASLLTMYILKRRRSKNQLAVYFGISVIFLCLLYSGVIDSFIMTFRPDYSGSYTASTTATRLAQINLFRDMIERMPLSYFGGLGLRNFIPTIDKWGNEQTYYFLDTGLLGDFFNLGVIVLVMIVPTLAILFKCIQHNKLQKNNAYYFSIGVVMFVLVGSIGYTVFSYARIITLPFIWAFCAYYKYNDAEQQKGYEGL